MSLTKLGFLGAGQMASALARGALNGKLLTAANLHFCDATQTQLDKVATHFAGCNTYIDTKQLFDTCDVVILSVKPQVLLSIAGDLASLIHNRHLIVSIAAGVSLPRLQSMLKTKNVVRVMPNTPSQVSAGVSAIASTLDSDCDSIKTVRQIFETVGKVVQVDDAQMDAVTGLSGSGPAYVLLMIEAMCDAGVANGLSRAIANTLAVQTVLGTAKMVQETAMHPAVLKDQVTSPAGTTIAGLRVLEGKGFRGSIIEAITEATRRSQELST